MLWCDRFDPCQAPIRSVPLPESGRRFGDLVLHDGEPRGRRRRGDHEVAVFDELTVLGQSNYGTWEIRFDADRPDQVDELFDLAECSDLAIEDWTANLRALCTACSEGAAHHHHDDDGGGGWQRQRRLGVAARSEDDLRVFKRLGWWWRRGIREVTRLV